MNRAASLSTHSTTLFFLFSSRSRVLVINTGGTIGMVDKGRGYVLSNVKLLLSVFFFWSNNRAKKQGGSGAFE